MKHSESQYQTPDRLNTRISIHEKYSTNPQPFNAWLFSHYEIRPGDRILEVGSGTGLLWENRLNMLPEKCTVTLSDNSLGMLDGLKRKFSSYPNIDVRYQDIQSLSFEKESFDIVIANMMLYHVPNLPQALSEVRRVLKPMVFFTQQPMVNTVSWNSSTIH